MNGQLRIETVHIDGLFGIFNHQLRFRSEDRITIVHGPNGIGKTTILRMLADLFKARFSRLHRTPFDSLSVTFIEGSSLRILKPTQESLFEEEAAEPSSHLFNIVVTSPAGLDYEYSVERSEGRPRFPLAALDRELPLTRIGARRWIDDLTGESLSLEDVAERYGDIFPALRDYLTGADPELVEFLNRLPIHLIETQRLSRRGPEPHAQERPSDSTREASAVVGYSQDFVEIIERDQARYGRLSQQLDRSFPRRLMEADPPSDVGEGDIRERYLEQESLRRRLMDAALLDTAPDEFFRTGELTDIERRVLSVYLNDTAEKLETLAQRLQRIEVFTSIINSRFQFKNMTIDREEGFRFTSSAGNPVPADGLSSGEQHELVLAYQLLFEVTEGSLVMIDEPELSLHVSWQQKFLDDLARISDVAKLDFLVATHSPHIVHNRWDLTEALEGTT